MSRIAGRERHARPAEADPGTPDQLISLLGVYAAQYASYTTLLWQVPALSLTAQAFLLTIALSHSNGTSAKVTSAALSAVISAASYALMYDQRGHADCYGELARRVYRGVPGNRNGPGGAGPGRDVQGARGR